MTDPLITAVEALIRIAAIARTAPIQTRQEKAIAKLAIEALGRTSQEQTA